MIEHSDPSNWPEGVRVISIDELDNLGIGPGGELYWKGRPVVTRRRFDLSSWQKVGAVVGVLSAFTVAVVSAAELVLKFIW